MRNWRRVVSSFLLTVLTGACSTSSSNRSDRLTGQIRATAADAIGCVDHLPADVRLDDRINPFYLRGDFDGDSIADYGFLVLVDEKPGVAICFSRHNAPVIAEMPNLGGITQLDFDDWGVFTKNQVPEGVDAGVPPTLSGDAIALIWTGSSAVLLYWAEDRIAYYGQGD